MKHTVMMNILLLLFLLLAGLTATTPAAAQTSERCFAETGYCISGPIRAYWEANGGLSVFGYPISEQRVETVEDRTIPVQWFERDRLEIQADGTITAGRLGARVLELQWRPWLPGNEQPIASPECRYFPQTGYNVCGWILGYWERNGGLERFGYPITSGTEEIIEGRTYAVQYFERRRMELHPNPERGVPDVLLGLLGKAVLTELVPPTSEGYPQCNAGLTAVMQQALWQAPAPEVLGCPKLYQARCAACRAASEPLVGTRMRRGVQSAVGRCPCTTVARETSPHFVRAVLFGRYSSRYPV